VNGEQTIFINDAEAWAIDDLVRHNVVEDGRNVGQGLLIKVFAVIREFEARRPGPPATLPIALTEDECWVVDYHIRRTYVDPMGNAVGRGLLLAVFGALLALRDFEAVRRLSLPDAKDREDDSNTRKRLDDYRRRLERDETEGEA
jgi:hypothetical protein